MKLVSFRHADKPQIGILQNHGQISLIDGFNSMRDLIRSEENPKHFISNSVVSIEGVEWQPPIPHPGKICCVAMNNSNSNSRKISAPNHPAFFLKPATCLLGHLQPIKIRPYYGSVHPEPELAAIIGKKTKDVNACDAIKNVFGYTIFNDITGNQMRSEDLFHYWALYADSEHKEDLVRREQHLSYPGRYKGTDNFGVMGPAIVTSDEILDPDNLKVTCKFNDITVAEDNTRYYNYKIAEVISFISQFQTLEPGDIISFGTAFKPSKQGRSIHNIDFQKSQGIIKISIEGLGSMENPIELENKTIGNWQLPKEDNL